MSGSCTSRSDSHNWTKEELKGEIRVRRMELEFVGQGWKVVAPQSYNHQGVDIELWRRCPDVLHSVFEVTNYTLPRTKVNVQKFRRYVENLNSYNWRSPKVVKWLVVSYPENLYETQYARLKKNNINVWVFHYTDLPKEVKDV